MFKRKFTSLLKSNNPEVVGLIEALQYDAVWFQEEGNPKFEIMNPYGDGTCMLRCISWFIDGSADHFVALRYMLIITKYERWYKSLLENENDNFAGFAFDWNNILEIAFRKSGSLDRSHLFALSNSLCRVFVLYGPVDGTALLWVLYSYQKDSSRYIDIE